MTIGLGIILLVLGLILLTNAVDLPDEVADAIASEPLGWIFVVVGGLAIVIGVLLSLHRPQQTSGSKRRRHDAGPYVDGPQPAYPAGPPMPPQGHYPPTGQPMQDNILPGHQYGGGYPGDRA